MAMGPNRGQEVRVNGPIGAPGQMRMDVGFPGQPGSGRNFDKFGKFVLKYLVWFMFPRFYNNNSW